jgi:hypothetical protein
MHDEWSARSPVIAYRAWRAGYRPKVGALYAAIASRKQLPRWLDRIMARINQQ